MCEPGRPPGEKAGAAPIPRYCGKLTMEYGPKAMLALESMPSLAPPWAVVSTIAALPKPVTVDHDAPHQNA